MIAIPPIRKGGFFMSQIKFEDAYTEGILGAGRLIAPKVVHKGYLSDETNAVYSIDMVRFNLKINAKKIDEYMKLFDTWTVPERTIYYRSNKLNGYRYLWSLKLGKDEVINKDITIAVGLGLTDHTGKVNESKGFVEFNPQKCKDKGIAFIKKLLDKGAKLETARFDLAIDFDIDRDTVRLIKDKRKYGCIMDDSFTEYLGVRNSAGYVKVYDKKVQYKLDDPLTRVELTCPDGWTPEQTIEKLPKVFCYSNCDFSNLKRSTKAFAVAVQAHLANGDSLEPWLNLCNEKTRAKLRKTFGEQQALRYDIDTIEAVVKDVEAIKSGTWCESEETQPVVTVSETVRYPQNEAIEAETVEAIKSIEVSEEDYSWLDDI